MKKSSERPKQRYYEVWTGYHKFFCRGKIMTGPQPWHAILTLLAFITG